MIRHNNKTMNSNRILLYTYFQGIEHKLCKDLIIKDRREINDHSGYEVRYAWLIECCASAFHSHTIPYNATEDGAPGKQVLPGVTWEDH